MKNTRFMEVLFSAVENNDEELANQVAKDIEDAKANGVVDTEEVKYESAGDGKVKITDKETGEVTVAEKADDEEGTYDLYPAEVTEQIEGFVHPEEDGVTPGEQVGAADEHVEDHMTGEDVIAPNLEDGGLNPEAGHEVSVEETAIEGAEPCKEEEGCEEKEFSVSTDNSVVLRIFSDQEFCERLFSEVIESEETVKIGDLKVEKVADEENAVVVTSESTGDQAKVTLDEDEMEVTELESKSFSDEEQFNALHVVGVDSNNHVIVDAPEYSEESANELVQRLAEQGVDAIQVFECPEEARDYAIELLNSLGVESEEDIEEPEQVEFSDHTVYLTKFYSNSTDFMCRMFSECCNDIDASQGAIEDAIENGDEIETDTEIITPIDSKSAVVEDKENGEFTKVTLDGETMNLNAISKEDAEELTDHLEVEEEGVDEEEKEFSEQIWCNEAKTKFFSESEAETMTAYMIRLFSEESDSAEIESAIEEGEQIENDTEIITPIDSCTAVIEDKETGEFTKAVMDDDKLDVEPISEEEANKLTDSLEVEESVEEKEKEEEKEEEKEFAFTEDPILNKFFSGIAAPATPANTAVFTVDENGNPVAPVESAEEGEDKAHVESVPSVESIEDKALAAVNSIQAAASEAEAAIMNAKAAPVENAQEDLKEAQFSAKNAQVEGTLLTWLNGNNKFRK